MPIVHEAAGFRKFRLWVNRSAGFSLACCASARRTEAKAKAISKTATVLVRIPLIKIALHYSAAMSAQHTIALQTELQRPNPL